MTKFQEDDKIILGLDEKQQDIISEFELLFRSLHRNYWYALRISVLIVIKFFECEQCGRCCINSPPIFKEKEAHRIADYLGKKVEDLPLTPIVLYFKLFYKAEKPCPFLSEENKCTIYSVRGTQCRAFPHEWLMYSMIPAYCPAITKALEKANSFIRTNREKIIKAIDMMEKDLKKLAGDSLFKEEMRYKEYKPLVDILFSILKKEGVDIK